MKSTTFSFPARGITGLCILLLLAVLIMPVSAGISQSTIAQGDTLYVNGQAPGSQQVALYFFGPNYFKYATAQVNSGSYTYELTTTSDMSPSQYYCVVQSPGTGSTFSVGPVTVGSTTYITVKPGSGVPADGDSFVVQGPNALQGSQAAYALEQMLQSPNIPDLSQTFTFTIEYPTITISSIGTQYMGTPFTVSGTTNLAAGDNLLVDVRVATFWPMSKEEANAQDSSSWSQGDSGSVIVQQGTTSGQNFWSFSVHPLHSSEYQITVTGIKTGATASQQFVVTNHSLPTPVPTTAATTAATTIPTSAPTPTQTPGFGLIAAVGTLGAAALLAVRRH
ncbi:hypothetical protein O0S10_09440 [Methanocorpusculum sp. MG]|uniref:DUF3821 domain-containing protein n=1 Tax=Methanocorpusculum petauri TaxID=3002863 RepID=A0ABT4II66_9EURY|nr:hypothetical protein [Methanocorpusculum petauri]MCZ0861437.1 hypothetical protein [Methanocorpusculum petauri]MDE2443861.1 hypothetical protein [Methanocorpusculum sp.]